MKKLLIVCSVCVILSGCLKDGEEGEVVNLVTIVGQWEQTVHKEHLYHMEATETTMKLYYYDDSHQIKYIVNGDYKNTGNRFYAKDLTTGEYRYFTYNMPHCDLLFVSEIQNGFIRLK